MTKLTKDAKALKNKIAAFLKSLGVDARPKRIKLTVDFLCDFVNEDHNKAVAESDAQVEASSKKIIEISGMSASDVKAAGYSSKSEMKRVELMKSAKTSKIIIP